MITTSAPCVTLISRITSIINQALSLLPAESATQFAEEIKWITDTDKHINIFGGFSDDADPESYRAVLLNQADTLQSNVLSEVISAIQTAIQQLPDTITSAQYTKELSWISETRKFITRHSQSSDDAGPESYRAELLRQAFSLMNSIRQHLRCPDGSIQC